MDPVTPPNANDEDLKFKSEYSSSTELEIDLSDLTLGVRTPKDITEATPRAIRNKVRRWHASGDVVHLSHGTFHGKPATLIIFHFRFSFEPQSASRFSRAEVCVNFLPDNISENAWPVVPQYGPKRIHSGVQVGEVTTTRSITASAALTAAPVPFQVGVDATAAKDVVYGKEFRTEVIGEAFTSDEADEHGCERFDEVVWTLTENKQQGDGVPRELRAAVLVQRDDGAAAFKATVQIRAKTSTGLALFGWPWSKPRPLVFREGVAFGSGPEVVRFEDMDERDWVNMVGIDRPYARIRATNLESHPERSVAAQIQKGFDSDMTTAA